MELNETIQTVQEPPAQVLKCSKCGELKAPTEFYTQPSCKSGRKGYCKQCYLARAHLLYVNRGGEKPDLSDNGHAGHAGAHANEQVASIVRELAILEYKNSQAHADAKARIEAVEAQKMQAIDGIASHVTFLQQELKKACAQLRKDGKPVMLSCIYGTVRYVKRELTVTLYPGTAWANKEKP